MGPVPPPASPRKITPEGERGRAGRAAPLRAGAVNAAAGGRAPPASCELANPSLCVPRRLSTPSLDSGGAETGDPSSAPTPAEPASRPGSFAAVPAARGEGAGVGAQALRGPPSAGSRLPRARGWRAGPAAPRCSRPLPLALTAFSGLGRFKLASTPQIPCNPSPRGSLSTHCANAFLSLSLSSLPLSLRTHALRLPGLATAPEGQLPPAWFHRLG